MDLNLKGKNAAISGATRGIGRAIAELLADEGCNVSICARNAQAVEATVADLAKRQITAFGAALDACDGRAQKTWIDDSANQLGGLDIFIANVGAANQGRNETAWRQSYDSDMMATVHGVEAALPHLHRSNGGAMVLISSIAALEVPGGPKPYGAMKAAMIHYAKGLARSLGPAGLRVNTVSPGNIYVEDGDWGETRRKLPKFFAKQVASNPLGRMGTPEEVAKAVVFLASPAASFVSGTNLLVDGALTMSVQY